MTQHTPPHTQSILLTAITNIPQKKKKKKKNRPLRNRNPMIITHCKSLIQDSVKREKLTLKICKALNRLFTQEDLQMASKHMKDA